VIDTYLYEERLDRQALRSYFVLIASILWERHLFWGASEVIVPVKAGSVGLFWGSGLIKKEGGVSAVRVLPHGRLLGILG